jgi:hypothetical protein
VESDNKGFIKASQTDTRFFEFSDGTPFVNTLVTLEQGSPFNTLSEIRENVQKLGQNGIRFVRWFPTGEGANMFIAPYGDTIRINWVFGDCWTTTDDPDTGSNKLFSLRPYYYSAQSTPLESGSRYKLSFRAKVEDEKVIRAEIGNLESIDICSSTSTYHESLGETCDYKNSGWNDYSIEVISPSDSSRSIGMRGLYVSTDAPSPFNNPQSGKIRIHSIKLQRDETGNGDWGANLLTRSDPETYTYVDQRSAARLDEILELSEQYDIYHKLTIFHKNDNILNLFQADGSIGDWYDCGWGRCPNNFYSDDGQAARWYENAYTRYFVGRWSYSPAIHSLELGNECDLYAESYNAGWHVAELVYNLSPRHIMMTNSFWGYFIADFFNDPEKGEFIDYGDKHWYSSEGESNEEVVSNIWNDSAAYVRGCTSRFNVYRNDWGFGKPIVRGEGGVCPGGGVGPQHPDVALEPTGTWYHKKLWAHVGTLGHTCDGEWYPRLFVTYDENGFPNSQNDTFKIYSTYDNFIQGEPLNNGNYQEIGTDLTGNEQIIISGDTANIRAWGSRDDITGRVLLWLDNSDYTWTNLVDGVSIPSASGDLTIQGLPQGTYQAEWWDTRSGTPTSTENYNVGSNGQLTFSVNNLDSDVAVKFSIS